MPPQPPLSHEDEDTNQADSRDDESLREGLNVTTLLHSCQTLHRELTEFESLYINTLGNSAANEIRPLRNAVASELKSLERLSANPSADPSPRTLHALRSSNLPFLSALWSTARAQSHIVAFQKRFYWAALASSGEARQRRQRQDQRKKQETSDNAASDAEATSQREFGAGDLEGHDGTGRPQQHTAETIQSTRAAERTSADARPKKRSALVDIVADDGALWVKVSTVSESRLLFELAKVGWEEPDSDDDADGSGSDADSWDGGKVSGLAHGPEGVDGLSLGSQKAGGSEDDGSDSDGDGRIELVKMAEDLQRAARATRVDYRHPRVLFVLPKLDAEGQGGQADHSSSGNNARATAIATVLASLRATGVSVHCGPLPLASSSTSPSTTSPSSSLPSLPSPHPPLTPVLNLDCTILLALASDLSHTRLDPTPSQHASIRRQIAVEATAPLLPTVLYPALAGGGRRLVASAAAARRMREIVATIGTEAERARAGLLLGEGEGAVDKEEVARRWAEASLWGDVGLVLPVQIIVGPEDEAEEGQQREQQQDRGVGQDSDDAPSDDITRLARARSHRPLPGWAARAETELRLSAVNRSTLWLGWRSGWLTVSSNRAVVRSVERVVDAWLDEREAEGEAGKGQKDGEGGGEEEEEELRGPRVWTCGVARSLVGKEIRRVV